ncbi:MAG: D-alanyl-D-alanine carboxypeptidase [Halanaerobiales bacterium]|nr:D-alanyl-D-alanine carboxypeptidase [Halanaerobiales bacterium]
MSRFKIIVTVLFVFCFLIPLSEQSEAFELDIEAAILVDAESGQVLYEKNADQALPPASITKIMTLLLAMEQVEKNTISLDDEVMISQLAESMGGSQIYLAANTRVKLSALLEAITIASANDASVAVSEAIAGSYNNFIDLMNKKAEELGMVNTNFVNSSGLPSKNHYSSARDIAVMSRELVKYPKILEWASIWVDYLQLPGRKAMLVNTNKLIRDYPGMDGIKTGHTDEAGFCLAATAQRDNMRLISVIMRASSEKEREELTSRLLDYGFNAFISEVVVKKGEQVQNIEIPDGEKTITVAEVANDLKVIYQRGTADSLKKKIVISEQLQAPIKKGDVLGRQSIMQDDRLLASVDLIATEDVERAGFFTRLWRSFVNSVSNLLQRILG